MNRCTVRNSPRKEEEASTKEEATKATEAEEEAAMVRAPDHRLLRVIISSRSKIQISRGLVAAATMTLRAVRAHIARQKILMTASRPLAITSEEVAAASEEASTTTKIVVEATRTTTTRKTEEVTEETEATEVARNSEEASRVKVKNRSWPSHKILRRPNPRN